MVAATRRTSRRREGTHTRRRSPGRTTPTIADGRVRCHHRFDGPDGDTTLLELFAGRRQLITYHAMLEPGAEPCAACSMFTDQLPELAHLHARDTTLVLTSRAPQSEIDALRSRMGWTVPWYTVVDEDFSQACGIDTGFGLSVFLRDTDRVFRTYATAGRATEPLGTVWTLLDLTPLGRQEAWEDTPPGRPQQPPYQWWRLHDDYPTPTTTTDAATRTKEQS